jgi:hypothetical protein
MRGKDGYLTVTVWGVKNTPQISNLFFRGAGYWESFQKRLPISGFTPSAATEYSAGLRRKEDRRGATERQGDRLPDLQRLSLSNSNKLNQMIHPSSVDGDVVQKLARP